MYSEKATKFEEIILLVLTNFLAFLENFTYVFPIIINDYKRQFTGF